MKILITNSVPLNGGDEALLIATIFGLNKYLNSPQINILCSDPDNVKKIIKYVQVDSDWEYTLNKYSNTIYDKVIRKIRIILKKVGLEYNSKFSIIFASKAEKKIIRLYREADYIISAPGGYLHDYYGYQDRISAYQLALKFNKKLIFLGHSIGPFFEKNKDQHKNLVDVLSRSRHIFLREKESLAHLTRLGYYQNNISVCTDIAFCLHEKYKHLFIQNKRFKNRIVVNFRNWNSPSNNYIIIEKAVSIVSYLLNKGHEITFLSTCQGLNFYRDDSEIATKIFSKLSIDLQEKVSIDRNKYSLEQLIVKFGEHNAYVGMRLHGAILSMLAGTPAFNIGYEDKSKGIYDLCGLANHQVHYDEKTSEIISKLDKFLDEYESMDLKAVVEGASSLALSCFKVFDHSYKFLERSIGEDID